MHGLPVTQPQIDYVNILCRKHKLTLSLLDAFCVQEFGAHWRELDRAQASQLIDRMKAWETLPADLQRAMGQRDLPGFGVAR